MITVDASVAVKWFVDEKERSAAMKVFYSGTPLAAPDLVIFEVLNVLRRKQRQQLVSQRQVDDAAKSIQTCFARLVAASGLVDHALELTLQLNHSVYDCAYLACAVFLDTNLLTADREFARKIAQTKHAQHVLTLDQL